MVGGRRFDPKGVSLASRLLFTFQNTRTRSELAGVGLLPELAVDRSGPDAFPLNRRYRWLTWEEFPGSSADVFGLGRALGFLGCVFQNLRPFGGRGE